MSSTPPSPADSDNSWVAFDGAEESVFFFKMLGLSPKTYQLFQDAGYNVWTSVNGGGVLETDRGVWEKICVPIGEQEKLAKGLDHYRNGTLGENYLFPGGSLKYGQQVKIDAKVLHGKGGSSLDDWTGIIMMVALAFILVSTLLNESSTLGLCLAVGVGVAKTVLPATWFVVIACLSCLAVWAPSLAAILVPAAPAAAPVVAAVAVATGDCVDGDTMVLTAERKRVPIRSLQPGDYILSYTKKKYVVRRVIQVIRTTGVPAERMCCISFAGAEDIIATRNHPFYVQGKIWSAVTPAEQHAVKAMKLESGDVCIDSTGKATQVTAIADLRTQAPRDVFNILVDSPGTWFAGSGVLCHSGIRAVIDGKENVENVANV